MANLSPIVHVVDDDPSFRTAIADLLSASGYRVALYESAMQLLERSPGDDLACILLDVRMTGLSGTQLQARLSERGSQLPIIFLTGYADIPTTVQAIKAGAEDVLTKPVSKDGLLGALKRALARFGEIRRQNDKTVVLRSLISRLTPREHEVFTLLVRGRIHKQIAYELGASERTVKFHRHNVMRKCQVKSLAELAVMAERLHLLTANDDSGNNTSDTLGVELRHFPPYRRPGHTRTAASSTLRSG